MSSKSKLNKDEISGQINSILEALTETNAKIAGLEEKHDAQHAEIKSILDLSMLSIMLRSRIDLSHWKNASLTNLQFLWMTNLRISQK